MFVDGKEASNVSVMEGDSVILKSGVTDVQKNDIIEWRFNGKLIDKFVDGLQLDSQTGDLKISNIRTKDSGLYKVKISSSRPTGSSEMVFTVKGVSFLYNSVIYHSPLSEHICTIMGMGRGAERKQILDYFQKMSDGIFFSYYLYLMHIKVVFISTALIFTALTKETLYCGCQSMNLYI